MVGSHTIWPLAILFIGLVVLAWFSAPGVLEAPADPPEVVDCPAPLVSAVYEGEHISAWYEGEWVGPRTCASNVFPRGTWLILGRGGIWVPVRVNDYGPADLRTGSTLDCSRDVARDLGFEREGHGTLTVYRVTPSPGGSGRLR